MKIIFFGTPAFASKTLAALIENNFKVIGVVSQPDKPSGRGLKLEATPVKIKALELGLPILEIDNLPLADLGIVVAYGKIIPSAILNNFSQGVINIHPSLLPRYRGPSPVQTALLNGDKETGVTIMLLDNKMDHGPILAQEKYSLDKNMTSQELLEVLMDQGTKLLIKTLPQWLDKKIQPRIQDESRATITKIITKEDGQIDWSNPAEQIERMVRAYNPWPGAWTILKGKRIKILKASLADKGDILMKCGSGTIVIEELQMEGKKAMGAKEFLRGYKKLFE